jgi:hypothetical protein
MSHIERLQPDTLSTASRKQLAQQKLIESIDALIEEADGTLAPTELSDVPVPDCRLARKVAAIARESLNTQTQALP